MSNTVQEKLGGFNEKQWDKFVKNSTDEEKKELKAVEEKSRINKGKNIEILKKHFHDRTCNLLASLTKQGERNGLRFRISSRAPVW